jgi:hypothetical protein
MLSSAAHVRKVQTVKVVEAINNRRAVRSFTAASVDPAVLRSLVDAAVLAPSAINLQPWRFAVARRRETLHKIAAEAKDHLLSQIQPGSPLLRFRGMLEDPAYEILYGAPALICDLRHVSRATGSRGLCPGCSEPDGTCTRAWHLLHRLGTTLAEASARHSGPLRSNCSDHRGSTGDNSALAGAAPTESRLAPPAEFPHFSQCVP